jgi:hypothetical protein
VRCQETVISSAYPVLRHSRRPMSTDHWPRSIQRYQCNSRGQLRLPARHVPSQQSARWLCEPGGRLLPRRIAFSRRPTQVRNTSTTGSTGTKAASLPEPCHPRIGECSCLRGAVMQQAPGLARNATGSVCLTIIGGCPPMPPTDPGLWEPRVSNDPRPPGPTCARLRAKLPHLRGGVVPAPPPVRDGRAEQRLGRSPSRRTARAHLDRQVVQPDRPLRQNAGAPQAGRHPGDPTTEPTGRPGPSQTTDVSRGPATAPP